RGADAPHRDPSGGQGSPPERFKRDLYARRHAPKMIAAVTKKNTAAPPDDDPSSPVLWAATSVAGSLVVVAAVVDGADVVGGAADVTGTVASVKATGSVSVRSKDPGGVTIVKRTDH